MRPLVSFTRFFVCRADTSLLGTPQIVFASGNTVSVGSKGKAVYVLCVFSLTLLTSSLRADVRRAFLDDHSCGSDSCTGNWDWSGLKVR